MGSLTGIKNKAGVITYWVNGKKVSEEDWEKHQDELTIRRRRPGLLLKKKKR